MFVNYHYGEIHIEMFNINTPMSITQPPTYVRQNVRRGNLKCVLRNFEINHVRPLWNKLRIIQGTVGRLTDLVLMERSFNRAILFQGHFWKWIHNLWRYFYEFITCNSFTSIFSPKRHIFRHISLFLSFEHSVKSKIKFRRFY